MEGMKFWIHPSHNNTFIATVMEDNSSLFVDVHKPKNNYDDSGALYYVVIVIFLYGFSIIMLIGSQVRKNTMDSRISGYLKEMPNVRKREEKVKVMQMQHLQAPGLGKLPTVYPDIGEEQEWSSQRSPAPATPVSISFPTETDHMRIDASNIKINILGAESDAKTKMTSTKVGHGRSDQTILDADTTRTELKPLLTVRTHRNSIDSCSYISDTDSIFEMGESTCEEV